MSEWLGSVMSGSVSMPPVRFYVGDEVDVLRAARLPKVEESIGRGVVSRISESAGEPLYWVTGFLVGRTARQLRLIKRGR